MCHFYFSPGIRDGRGDCNHASQMKAPRGSAHKARTSAASIRQGLPLRGLTLLSTYQDIPQGGCAPQDSPVAIGLPFFSELHCRHVNVSPFGMVSAAKRRMFMAKEPYQTTTEIILEGINLKLDFLLHQLEHALHVPGAAHILATMDLVNATYDAARYAADQDWTGYTSAVLEMYIAVGNLGTNGVYGAVVGLADDGKAMQAAINSGVSVSMKEGMIAHLVHIQDTIAAEWFDLLHPESVPSGDIVPNPIVHEIYQNSSNVTLVLPNASDISVDPHSERALGDAIRDAIHHAILIDKSGHIKEHGGNTNHHINSHANSESGGHGHAALHHFVMNDIIITPIGHDLAGSTVGGDSNQGPSTAFGHPGSHSSHIVIPDHLFDSLNPGLGSHGTVPAHAFDGLNPDLASHPIFPEHTFHAFGDGSGSNTSSDFHVFDTHNVGFIHSGTP